MYIRWRILCSRRDHRLFGIEQGLRRQRAQSVGGSGRAGARTAHAGCVGRDGLFLLQQLEAEGVDISGVRVTDAVSGHAVIQVDAAGQNAILLYPGTNHALTREDIAAALAGCAAGDWLLVQNETNGLEDLLRGAAERGVRIALNPSPITPELAGLPLDLVDCFLLNEIEGAALSGAQRPQEVLDGAAVPGIPGRKLS